MVEKSDLMGKKGCQSPRNKYSLIKISHTKSGHWVSQGMSTCSQLLCVQFRLVGKMLGKACPHSPEASLEAGEVKICISSQVFSTSYHVHG